jgi:hypothetical protein
MSYSDHDPVKDFFDAERRQIVSQPGDDLHWQSILRRSRAQRRSRFLGYAAGLTAASLVLGSVSYGAFLHGAFDGGANVSAILPGATNSGTSAMGTPRPSATSDPAPGTATSPPQGLSPIDALLPQLSKAEERTIWEAQRKLIRGCMLAKGINFTYPAWEVGQAGDATRQLAAAATAKAAFANPAWARANGYGLEAKAFITSQKVPQTGGGGSVDARTDAALNGSDLGATITLASGMADDGSRGGAATPAGGQLTYPETGCQAEAIRGLYGDLRQYYTLGYITTVVSNLRVAVTSAPAVSASLLTWRGCMASRGWASFQRQPDAFGKVYAAYSSRQPDARKLELSIAPADAACTLSSGYGVAFRASEDKVAGDARRAMSARITPLLEMQRKAVAAATTVLRS